MPIYEYDCKKCGEFEVTQRISEPELKKCPTCGRKVTKLISQSAFHLKGAGWYATDYGKNGKSTSSSDSTETKSDTKDSSSSTASSSGSSTKESASKSASTSTT